MSDLTVNDMMEAYALDAIDFATANFAQTLDRSEASVEHVELIAGQLFATIPQSKFAKIFKRGPSDDELDQACKMLGAYIGEVIRAEFGGDWSFNQEIQPGNLVLELKVGEAQLFPPAKVWKRLKNGDEDNLWSYYRVMRELLLEKHPA